MARQAFPMAKNLWRPPSSPSAEVKIALLRNFEFKLPLAWLLAKPVSLAAALAEKKLLPRRACCACASVCGRTVCPSTRSPSKDGLNSAFSVKKTWLR